MGRGGGGGGGGAKKLRNTFQRLGLRSFRPEISAWGVFVGRRFRPGPKSPKSRISEISNQSKFGSFLTMRSD